MPFTAPRPIGLQDDENFDPEQNPLDALHTLLTGTSPTTVSPLDDTPRRNNAIAGALRKKYGLGPDDLSISQSDLEDLDRMFRGSDLNEKVTESVAPIQARGAVDTQLQGMRGQNALDVENLRGQYGLESEAMKAGAARDVANIKEGPFAGGGGGSPEGSDLVDYWANQVLNSPKGYTVLSSLKDKNLLEAVQQRIAQKGGDVKNLTNQTQQMGESASALLDQMPSVLSLGEHLNQQGLFNPVIGPIRSFFAKHGVSSLMGVDPQTSSDIGDFETQMGLLQSGIARAHAGARGAGNSEIAKRFEDLLNAKGDYSTFLGKMHGAASFLQQYQAALKSGANPDNPNDPLMRQLEQQLRAQGGSPAGADLGPAWGQQE